MACLLNSFVRPSSAERLRANPKPRPKSSKRSERRKEERRKEAEQRQRAGSVPATSRCRSSIGSDAGSDVGSATADRRMLLDIRLSHETSLGVCTTRPIPLPNVNVKGGGRALAAIEKQIRECEKSMKTTPVSQPSALVQPMPQGHVPTAEEGVFTSEQRANYFWKEQPSMDLKKSKLLTRPYDERYKYRRDVVLMGDSLRSPKVRSY